jgi:glutamate racemase
MDLLSSSLEAAISPDRPTESAAPSEALPIGVFDSGIGGLTVVSAIRELLPGEDVYYIGDTARVPYGGKSPQTIERYSVEIAGLLLAEGAKMIVVACNTASALAVPRLRKLLRVPVIGVVEPGAAAAVRATRNGHIGVIGTKATVRSKAYERAIRALQPQARVTTHACPMLVPLIEEGWLDDPITDQVIARYLEPLLAGGVDTLVLGCTHYPLLAEAIGRVAGDSVHLVNSARNCADAVKTVLETEGIASPLNQPGRLRVAVTDSPDGFLRIAEEKLNLHVGEVELVAVQGAREE